MLRRPIEVTAQKQTFNYPKDSGKQQFGTSVFHPLQTEAVGWYSDELLPPLRGCACPCYEYWMLGGAAKSERPPRWSVIKDVLKWVN